MNTIELTSVGALVAAVAALLGLYYQRTQIRLLERQTALSEREFDEL